jgi:hypothetical protein
MESDPDPKAPRRGNRRFSAVGGSMRAGEKRHGVSEPTL